MIRDYIVHRLHERIFKVSMKLSMYIDNTDFPDWDVLQRGIHKIQWYVMFIDYLKRYEYYEWENVRDVMEYSSLEGMTLTELWEFLSMRLYYSSDRMCRSRLMMIEDIMGHIQREKTEGEER